MSAQLQESNKYRVSCNAVGEIVDSRFFGDGFSTEEGREIFCDIRRLQRWLDVEVALAEAQAEIGMIPTWAAREIVQCARLDLFDLEQIRQDIAATGHSLVPLLRAWQAVVGSDAGQYIHYGATTQDIQDTAQSLEIRDSLDVIERDFRGVQQDLTVLAHNYRDLVMVARTHGQYALPTTLGLKIAVWIDEGLRNLERLDHCRETVPMAQLFGGVGTMAAFGDRGLELIERFANKLNLHTPATAWHSSRDRIAEFLSVLALLTGGLAKIANEIIALNQNEIGELSEPFVAGQVGSSTMPHKRNPELSERIVALAKLVRSHASLGFDSLVAEHERDYRCVRLEWITVTDSVLHTCTALNLMHVVLSGLVVNEENIRRHTESSADMLSSEALMFRLGDLFGKQTAHQIVYEASMRAAEKGTSVIDELLCEQRVVAVIDRANLEAAVDPSNYLGASGAMVDRVVRQSRRSLAQFSAPVVLAKCTLHCLRGCRATTNSRGLKQPKNNIKQKASLQNACTETSINHPVYRSGRRVSGVVGY
jgi:adenylosuccinate lyase